MPLTPRAILTLVALLLVNSGVGRALHTAVEHGSDPRPPAPASETSLAADHACEPGAEDHCPQCDLLRAGTVAPHDAGAVAWTAMRPLGRVRPTEAAPRAPPGADAARPRAPPIA